VTWWSIRLSSTICSSCHFATEGVCEPDRESVGRVTMLGAGVVESERGWFGVVAGSARDVLPPIE